MGHSTWGAMPALLAGDVHIWHLDLRGDEPSDAAEHLSDTDRRQADRFVFARDRSRFLRARCGLRQLLGAYLGVPPRELPLTLNRHGKPLLDPPFALGFNLSHSGDHGLLAVSRAAEVGVDIEVFARMTALRHVAASVFTREELRSLDRVAPDRYERAFLTGWTRKEALLKALGVGLTIEPACVHAGTDAGRSCIARPGGLPGTLIDVATLPADERFVAAVAVAGGFSTMRLFEVNHEFWQHCKGNKP